MTTQQATPAKLHVSKPDQNGAVTVRPAGANYEVRLYPFIGSGDSGDDTPRFVSIENELATQRDDTLREMEAREENLGDQRWSTRGEFPDVDKLYDEMNGRRFDAWVAVTREAVTAIASLFDRDVTEALDGAAGDAYAGCRTCKCSPGVSLARPLIRNGQIVNVYIRRLRPAPKHRLSFAQVEALRFAANGTLIRDEHRHPHRYYVKGRTEVVIRPVTVDALWRLNLLRAGDRTGDRRPLLTNEHGTFELYARG